MNLKFYALLAWAQSHGLELNGVEILYISKQKGYGIFATRDLQPGEVIIKTPLKTELTHSKIICDEYFSEVKKHQEKLTIEELLILAIALEKQKGKDSEYHFYIDFLPGKFHFGNMDAEMDEMPLSARLIYQMESDSRRDIIKKIKEYEPTISQASLQWAYTVYRSRGFEKNRSFSPIIDLMNASQTPHAWVRSRIWTSKEEEQRDFANVIISEDVIVKKDSEVFLSYAEDLNNTQLWCRYGFTFPNNKNNKDVIMNINEVVRLLQSLQFFSDAGKGDGSIVAAIEDRDVSAYMKEYFAKVFDFYGERARGTRRASGDVMKKEFFQKLWEDRSKKKEDADPDLEYMWNDELQLISRVLQKL